MNRHHVQLFAAAVVAVCVTQAAIAHAFLDHAEPKVGATLTAPPAEIKIWFDDDVLADKSDIQVFDAAGKQVDKKDTHGEAKDKSLLIVTVPTLPPGAYKVVWHALCPDTHRTSSEFQFTVKPG